MRLTEKVHCHLEAAVREGDFVIDATAGNGHDTLKLASLVGPKGRVMAIDVQEQAIASTRRCLQQAGHESQVRLIEGNHAEVLASLENTLEQKAAAIIFNLGYLPGSDKRLTTSAETTITAVKAALPLLAHGGLLLVTAYRGHPGGQAEAEVVARWAESLDRERWSVRSEEPPMPQGPNLPPVLWIIRNAFPKVS
jgi:precorrin-6B methylase 2